VEAMDIFRSTEINGGVVQLVNHPNRYDGQVPELRVKGLKIGEHTRSILTELGYSAEKVDDLVARNVVFSAAETPNASSETRKKKISAK